MLPHPNRPTHENQPPPAAPPAIVIEGGTLLSMVEGASPIQNARVHVRSGRIFAVGKADDAIPCPEGTEVLDASNGIILPGLINGHCHAAMTLFRGLADDLPLNAWLFEKIFPAEARHLNPRNRLLGRASRLPGDDRLRHDDLSGRLFLPGEYDQGRSPGRSEGSGRTGGYRLPCARCSRPQRKSQGRQGVPGSSGTRFPT